MTDRLTVRLRRGSNTLIDLLLREIAGELSGSVEELYSPAATRHEAEFEVTLAGVSSTGTLSIRVDHPDTAALSVGSASGTLPVALRGRGPFVVDARRVLLACAASGDRRAKMTARIAGELRRRGTGVRLVIADEAPADAIRMITPDDVYADLDGPELGNLLAGVSCCIDAAGEGESPTLGSIACGAAGVPLLVAPGSRLSSSSWPSVTVTEGFYPDAFCDAMANAGGRREPAGTDAMARAAAAFLEVVRRGIEP
ncbi:MAG: hypothetical protein ACYC7A_11935 [Thermoanaerobaculia bacterium]